MASTGRYLCGGMSYASLDFYENGRIIPGDTAPPPVGSALNSYLLTRQVNAHQFMLRTLPFKAAHHSTHDQFEWGMRLGDDFGRVVRRIDAGRPTPILMMALNSPLSTESHWTVVVGYAMQECAGSTGGPVRRCGKLFLYDSNHPEIVSKLIPDERGECFVQHPSGARYRTYWPDESFRSVRPDLSVPGEALLSPGASI
jgi:hypothetical protein